MKNHYKYILLFFTTILALFSYLWYFDNKAAQIFKEAAFSSVLPMLPEKIDRTEEVAITSGATYGDLMEEAGISYEIKTAIYEAALPIYDLAKIRCERCLKLIYDKDTDELKELVYRIDSEDELHIKKIGTSTPLSDSATSTPISQTTWTAEIIPIPYEVKIRTAQGEIESSMYQAAIDNEIDIRAIIELANAFQWTIDFAMDPRVGDTFKFIYEERFLDGEYVMPGQILAGKYINDGQAFYVYFFAESDDNIGFFDEQGNSVQKMFLKAPVAYKYISSGYTTGPRYIDAFQTYTADHRAIDYAAAMGTPIRAVGDGTVTFAGWKTSYGYFVSLHHNATYSTNYAHLSQPIVKVGQKVKQSEVIGYVGSTGFSTGPHLHFEMVKNGVKVNPLKEILPPGEPIKEENKERFFAAIKQYQEILEAE
jgi:murein DD-endopeptidase MepM/ murein hydrolase activator NlpD